MLSASTSVPTPMPNFVPPAPSLNQSAFHTSCERKNRKSTAMYRK